jgi:TfoX/Sxy family transcriptional regulator of competence genes
MATDPGYAKYVCDQLQMAGGITTIKMFGEYGLYRHGKIVALIADNQFFVKPTPEGVAVLGTPSWGPPYPGAKPFINASDLLDDPETLVRLILATDAALPPPKAKKKAPVAAKASAKKSAPGKKTPVRAAVRKKKQAAAKRPASRKAKPKRKAPARKTPVRKKAGKKKR